MIRVKVRKKVGVAALHFPITERIHRESSVYLNTKIRSPLISAQKLIRLIGEVCRLATYYVPGIFL